MEYVSSDSKIRTLENYFFNFLAIEEHRTDHNDAQFLRTFQHLVQQVDFRVSSLFKRSVEGDWTSLKSLENGFVIFSQKTIFVVGHFHPCGGLSMSVFYSR